MTKAGVGSMEFNEDDLVLDFSTSGSLDDLVIEFLETDERSREYLKARWIEDTIFTLRTIRRSASLTQAEVARRMGTRQSAIARLEGEDDITLGKVWDYFYACGVAPTKIEHVNFSVLRDFIRSQPDNSETMGNIIQHCRNAMHQYRRLDHATVGPSGYPQMQVSGASVAHSAPATSLRSAFAPVGNSAPSTSRAYEPASDHGYRVEGSVA